MAENNLTAMEQAVGENNPGGVVGGEATAAAAAAAAQQLVTITIRGELIMANVK